MSTRTVETIRENLASGRAIPYLGPGMLALAGKNCPLPASPEELVDRLTARASVPHKIRKNLTAAAQFIENFKHRKTVKAAMTEAFGVDVEPTPLHRYLASLSLRLIVHAWYDDLPQRALARRKRWGIVQGVSQAEHFGEWDHYFGGEAGVGRGGASDAASWMPLLYQPLGSVSPASNFLVSDSDFVEVLTEIDIQTPIPEAVRNLRKDRSFLFLGCRFATQLERIFAHQIVKRSSDRHWAVLPEEPTRNEARFLAQHNIERIAMPLASFATLLTGQKTPVQTQPAVALAS
jgi:hypothetical protein